MLYACLTLERVKPVVDFLLDSNDDVHWQSVSLAATICAGIKQIVSACCEILLGDGGWQGTN